VEEGSNSPSQESVLNRELAWNNNQCKIISVSDSVTSTGSKESKSESEGDELNHKTSKRTMKNTRSRFGDFFMDITHNGIGMTVELDNSPILFTKI